MLLPLLGAALLSATLVAIVSWSLGRRWALRDVHDRFGAIETTLHRSRFPLTSSVLDSLAGLTDTDLIALGRNGVVISQTLSLSAGQVNALRDHLAAPEFPSMRLMTVDGKSYLKFACARTGIDSPPDRVEKVLVLFEQRRIDEASRRAAMLPLITGLSTIAIVSLVMFTIAGTLVRRLIKLKESVQRVAAGDFETTVSDQSRDEVGQLGNAVDQMSRQLSRLWKQVHRDQSEKLLHQIAGGMAHQLRNTLAGSRMAIELHQRGCSSEDKESVQVAIREMEVAESYVRRLLMVGSGESSEVRPENLIRCLQDVRSSHAAVAGHLNVESTWDWTAVSSDVFVADGSAFSAALSNLVLNAMQAAEHVNVVVRSDHEVCHVRISDDGPGIDPAIAAEIFDPLVTSKPEGMGLGLPLVRRAARKLGGDVDWLRQDGYTVFRLHCRVQERTSTEQKMGTT